MVAAFLGTDLVDPKARAGDFGFGSAILSVFSTLTSLDSASLLGVCTKLFLIMLMTLGAFSTAVGTAGGAICTLSALLLAFGAVDLPKMLDTLPATCSAKLFRGSTLGLGAAMVFIGAFGGMAFATLATGIAGAFLVTGATVCVAAPAISVTLMVGVLVPTDPAMVFGTTGTTSATLMVGVLDTVDDWVDPAVCVACVVKAT